jgi:hypothetical protein
MYVQKKFDGGMVYMNVKSVMLSIFKVIWNKFLVK